MSSARDEEPKDKPVGHIEFDARGNAVWTADETIRTEDTLIRRLRTSQLSLDDSPAFESKSLHHLETGFDPYSSGNVVRDAARGKKTDLRKLSEEILRKRKLEGGT